MPLVSHRQARMRLGLSTRSLYRLVNDGYLTRTPEGEYDSDELRSLQTLRSDAPSTDELCQAVELYRSGLSARHCAFTLAIHYMDFVRLLTQLDEPVRGH